MPSVPTSAPISHPRCIPMARPPLGVEPWRHLLEILPARQLAFTRPVPGDTLARPIRRQGGRLDFRTAFDFSGRCVVVIGASRGGIGAAIAAAFAQCGASATITGVEPKPIDADRGRYPYVQLDVTDAG